MTSISSNLYALCSMDPIADAPGNMQVFSCLPVDFDKDGLPADSSRYVTLVMVPDHVRTYDILPCFQASRAYSAQWITYMWEVS